MTSTDAIDPRRRGGWLPAGAGELEAWLEGHRRRAGERGSDALLHPAVQAFRDLIEGDPLLRMLAHRMIAEESRATGYSEQPLESVDQMLVLIDEVLTLAPEYGEQMVATPLGAILDWTMGTPAGFAFYRDPRVNEALRRILDAWSEFLDGPESLAVLNRSATGWMSEAAVEAIGIDQFQHDPDDPHWGFTSWNDFFTRRLAEGARPVADPDDPSVITAVCEATSYRIANGVRRSDEFWIKSEPYSLDDLFAHDAAAAGFVDGTIYQAYLGPTDYHRWHSPVAGTVVRAFVEPGTYYSEADSQEAGAAEPTNSQGYLAHVATRAIVLMEADEPGIGLVGVVLIGMSDVSSCVLAPHVGTGAHLEKGEELGWFQYGGSSYCIAFRPGVVADFALDAVSQGGHGTPAKVPVRSRLARARI